MQSAKHAFHFWHQGYAGQSTADKLQQCKKTTEISLIQTATTYSSKMT